MSSTSLPFPPAPLPSGRHIHGKCVLIGDTSSGKTSALLTYTTRTFPSEYTPSQVDPPTFEFQLPLLHGSKKEEQQQVMATFKVDFWDTVEYEPAFDHLRLNAYSDVDLFLLCFSITSIPSFEHIRTKYLREIQQHCPDVPFILVGMKSDRREEGETENTTTASEYVSQSTASAFAKEIGAAGEYIECSALKKDNLAHLFEEAARIAIRRDRRKKSCVIL